MSIPSVTVVTSRAASADELTERDYRDIYDELREKASLDKFVLAIGSAVSKAWWSKYERWEVALSRERRNELRVAVGLARLPETVADAAAAIDPDATIYQVGAGAANRVVMVGAQVHEPLTLRLNGRLEVGDGECGGVGVWGTGGVGERGSGGAGGPENVHVTGVTAPRRNRSYRSLSVSDPTYARLSAARLARGVTWDALLGELLDAAPCSASHPRQL